MSVVDLNTISQDDRKHFILCPVCNVYIDCRDLGEVFDHIHEPNLENASHHALTNNYTGSYRVDEPEIEYLKTKGKTRIHKN